MSCKCQSCGNQFTVDLLIDNILWEKIRNGKNLDCGPCIMQRIEKISTYAYYFLNQPKPSDS